MTCLLRDSFNNTELKVKEKAPEFTSTLFLSKIIIGLCVTRAHKWVQYRT